MVKYFTSIYYILSTTDVAKILSFGKMGFGSITDSFWKLKFFIPLAQAPIFSDSWGLCNIKVILFDDIVLIYQFL